MSVHYINFILQLADNALIIGHRLSEWCGHGPVLEQDIALTNTSLDHIGQCRNLYQYAASLINALPKEEKLQLFDSVMLNEKLSQDAAITEDDLAYLRDAWDYKNVQLIEQPNQDWAYTIIRSFLYDHFTCLLYEALSQGSDTQLAAIAEKSLKECLYHRKWSSEWVIRLGDGTEESHERIRVALEDRWPYFGEMFIPSQADIVGFQHNGLAPLAEMKSTYTENISPVLAEATLEMPDPNAWMHTGGKTGTHTEHLGYILADLQFLQRTYPDMEW